MIDGGLIVEYLKPELWTNLGVVIAPLVKRGKILHILHTAEGKFKGVVSDHQSISLEHFVNQNGLNIQNIFEKYCDIIEIRIYTIPGLVSYYRESQKHQVYMQDIDEYLISLYHTQENSEGIQIYKRNGNEQRCYLAFLKSLLENENEDTVIFLWLTNKDKLFFNCILEFSCGRLKCISTSDRYAGAEEKYEVIGSLIHKEYGCRVVPVKMELDEYISRFNNNRITL